MSAENEAKLTVSLPIDVSYSVEEGSAPEGPVAILLHGYRETKDHILDALGPKLKDVCKKVISLNGPFPVPKLGPGGFKESYAWFFRSSRQGITIIPPSVCEAVFFELKSECLPPEEDVVAIGFSQGGYVLPYLSKAIPEAKLLVGISTSFLSKDYKGCPVPVIGIHAEDDNMISLESSREQFYENWPQRSDSFIELEGGHELDEAKSDILISYLKQYFSAKG